MNFFNTFVLSFGAFLALTAVISAWLFRTSSARIYWLVVPALLVTLACVTPILVGSLMGFPVTVAFNQLPERAELVAFVPHDDAGNVDLWLKETDTPRAYETVLDAKMKKTLREAQERQARGERTMLQKQGGNAKPGTHHSVMSEDITHSPSEYTVDPDAFGLPKKEGE